MKRNPTKNLCYLQKIDYLKKHQKYCKISNTCILNDICVTYFCVSNMIKLKIYGIKSIHNI